jgi:hypothetical protein
VAPKLASPSAPSVRTPAAAQRAATGTTSSSSTSGSGSGSSSRSGGGGNSSHGVSAASHGRSGSPAARRHRRAAHERRLRNVVHRYAGCLSRLDGQEEQLLSLRAGVDSAPMSRAAAAGRLGITRHEARSLERTGLRRLRAEGRSGECGSSGSMGRNAADIVADGSHMPQLRPTVFLASNATLASPAALAGHQAVKGAHASSSDAGQSSSGSGGGGGGGGSTPALVHGTESASTSAEFLIAAAVLALLLAIVLITWRRRNMGREYAPPPVANWWDSPAGDLPEAPAWAPPPIDTHASAATAPAATTPAAEDPSTVRPLATDPPQQHGQRRPVAVVAASLLSLGVTALLRRRRH